MLHLPASWPLACSLSWLAMQWWLLCTCRSSSSLLALTVAQRSLREWCRRTPSGTATHPGTNSAQPPRCAALGPLGGVAHSAGPRVSIDRAQPMRGAKRGSNKRGLREARGSPLASGCCDVLEQSASEGSENLSCGDTLGMPEQAPRSLCRLAQQPQLPWQSGGNSARSCSPSSTPSGGLPDAAAADESGTVAWSDCDSAGFTALPLRAARSATCWICASCSCSNWTSRRRCRLCCRSSSRCSAASTSPASSRSPASSGSARASGLRGCAPGALPASDTSAFRGLSCPEW